ncbi:MAG: hypothetical protein ABIB43_01100 [archaeon]
MNQLEQNIVESFRLAKNDIIKLQDEVIALNKAIKKQNDDVSKLKLSHSKLQEKVKNLHARKPKVTKTKVITVKKVAAKKTVTKRAAKKYLAAKGGKKFHESNCPYAKNIKPKNKILFKSTTKALNEGYKACKCAQ